MVYIQQVVRMAKISTDDYVVYTVCLYMYMKAVP